MLIHRLESLSTQLQAFISIVILTTRYPRLQRLFGTCGYIQRVGNSHNTISSLWMRVDGCDQESLFCLKYAAFRVSDNFIAIQMEKINPVGLGYVYKGELGVIERLLLCCR
jgi:hypothetical protein